jgi:hypothetical protein
MDGEDRVAPVVLAAEHLAGLGRLDVAGERLESRQQLRLHRLARLRPLDEHAEIVGPALERVAEAQLLLEPAAALQQLLRLALVLPEVGLGDPRLDARELGAVARGVKDSSADRRIASRDPGTA